MEKKFWTINMSNKINRKINYCIVNLMTSCSKKRWAMIGRSLSPWAPVRSFSANRKWQNGRPVRESYKKKFDWTLSSINQVSFAWAGKLNSSAEFRHPSVDSAWSVLAKLQRAAGWRLFFCDGSEQKTLHHIIIHTPQSLPWPALTCFPSICIH